MIDPDKLNRQEITNVIIGVKPNTYTFTKALAENVKRESEQDIVLEESPVGESQSNGGVEMQCNRYRAW